MSEFLIDGPCVSQDEFIKGISYGGKIYNEVIKGNSYLYRGVPSIEYELIPSALRGEGPIFYDKVPGEKNQIQVQNEYVLLGCFFQACDKNGLYIPNASKFKSEMYSEIPNSGAYNHSKWIPEEMFQIAALAQHYGIQTRLLDWTHNINVALYFAFLHNLSDKEKLPTKVAVWAFNHRYTKKLIKEMSQKGVFCPLHFVRPPYYGNPNLAAQKGLFTLWQIKGETPGVNHCKYNYRGKTDRRPLDTLLKEFFCNNGIEDFEEPVIIKYSISINDISEVSEMYKYLELNHADASYLFPGYKGCAEHVNELLNERKIISRRKLPSK